MHSTLAAFELRNNLCPDNVSTQSRRKPTAIRAQLVLKKKVVLKMMSEQM
jgi:hypothetical protein